MELEPLFKYGLPVLTIFAVGLLGRTRRIGFWGAVIVSILLTPIGGFLVALASGERRIDIGLKPQEKPAKSESQKK